MAATTGWVRRCVRLYRPDRNPLRRRSDRWEALVVAFAIGLVLLSVWPVTLVSGAVYRNGLREEAAGPKSRQFVLVTLVATATGGRQWQRQDGTPVTGHVTPFTELPVGTTQRVWVDGRNQVTIRPREHAETLMSTAVAAFGLELSAIILVFFGYRAARYSLDRGRYAEWTTAWAVAEERWHRHRPT